MTYRKIGGLHFITIGRFGFTWYWSRKRRPMRVVHGWHTLEDLR